jgi:WD40 repeat protein
VYLHSISTYSFSVEAYIVRYSPDGSMIALGLEDRYVRVYDAEDLRRYRLFDVVNPAHEL